MAWDKPRKDFRDNRSTGKKARDKAKEKAKEKREAAFERRVDKMKVKTRIWHHF